jgi:hypothetical protein
VVALLNSKSASQSVLREVDTEVWPYGKIFIEKNIIFNTF